MDRVIKVGDFTITYKDKYQEGIADHKPILVTNAAVHCYGTHCEKDCCPFYQPADCHDQAILLLRKYSKITRTKELL